MVQTYVEQFDTHYRNFRTSALDSTLDVRYGIIEYSKKAGGVYYKIENFTKISSVHFEDNGSVLQQYIVFHELGHHVLRRNHFNKLMDDGCPRSIMHKNTHNRECYIQYHKYYIKELFDGFHTIR